MTLKSSEKTAAFLYKATRVLPNNDLYTVIRSNMMKKGLDILQLPPDKLHSSKCSVCGVEFKYNVPIQRIEPRKQKTRFLRRVEQGKVRKTKYNLLSHRKFCKRVKNKQRLITSCQKCKKEYKTVIQVPSKPPKPAPHVLRKGNKKDRLQSKRLMKYQGRLFAGLNKNAVLSVAQNLKYNKNEQNTSSNQKKSLLDYIPLSSTPRNNTIINLCTPVTRKQKRKAKILAKMPKVSEESKKQKTANAFLNLLNTTPNSKNGNSALETFLINT